jgi:hypothetical protein
MSIRTEHLCGWKPHVRSMGSEGMLMGTGCSGYQVLQCVTSSEEHRGFAEFELPIGIREEFPVSRSS